MIARTPPMGWNSWDCYGAAVTEEQVKKNADYLADNMKKYGWEYVVVDIQWAQPTASSHEYEPFSRLEMDKWGRLIPAVNRFPSSAGGLGFKPLADYVHAKGLKFGIHIMRGIPRQAAYDRLPVLDCDAGCADLADPSSICKWNPDMYGVRLNHPKAQAYYDSIFKLYASWGVDFVKCDDIAREYPHCEKEIEMISSACRNCGREMLLSLSPGPAPLERAEHLKMYANMWRITDDFWDDWKLLKAMFERAEKWCIHGAPGHWPDADMLPVGALRQCYADGGWGGSWTRFSKAEQRTMMTLWCMMRSPLMVGAELTKNDDFTLQLLTTEKVLNLLKRTSCAQPMYTTEEASLWMAQSKCAADVVALFNLSDVSRKLQISEWETGSSFASALDLWNNRVLQADRDTVKDLSVITVEVAPHDVALLELHT